MHTRLLFLVRIKHWQLFLIWILAFLIGLIILIIEISIHLPEETGAKTFPGFPAAFAYLIQGIWTYIVTIKLRQRYAPQIGINAGLFQSCLYFAMTYYILGSLLPDVRESRILIAWLLNWAAFLSSLYAFYVAGSTLVASETQEVPRSRNAYLESLGFFLFPIGVWFLQPRINKILKDV